MEKENKKEEIQSRREFFKDAARKGLPIIAAIALAGTPLITKAESEHMESQYCSGGCSGGCYGGCHRSCGSRCALSCEGVTHKAGPGASCPTCNSYCAGCTGYCCGSCKGSCYRQSYTV